LDDAVGKDGQQVSILRVEQEDEANPFAAGSDGKLLFDGSVSGVSPGNDV
jgi:hypothetical protein